MKIAGPLLQQLAPLAIDALSKAGQEEQDLGFGFNGGFNTPFGGASGGFGWNQEQQDLQLGGLIKLGLSLLGSQQQQNLKELTP